MMTTESIVTSIDDHHLMMTETTMMMMTGIDVCVCKPSTNEKWWSIINI